MSNSLKKTIIGMGFGIFLYELFLTVALLLLAPKLGYTRTSICLGILIGTIAAFIMLIHMGFILEDVLASNDSEYAGKKTVLHNFIRKAGLILLLFLCWRFMQVNILALILAVLGIKPGAYLQPFADKIFFGKKNL